MHLLDRPCPACSNHSCPVFFWGTPLPHPHGFSWAGPCTPSCLSPQALRLERELPQQGSSGASGGLGQHGLRREVALEALLATNRVPRVTVEGVGVGVAEPELDQGMHGMVPWSPSRSIRSPEQPDSSLSAPTSKPSVSPACWTLRTFQSLTFPWLLLLPTGSCRPVLHNQPSEHARTQLPPASTASSLAPAPLSLPWLTATALPPPLPHPPSLHTLFLTAA